MSKSIYSILGGIAETPKQISIDPLNKDVIVALAKLFDISSLERVSFNSDTFSMTITRSEEDSPKPKAK